MNRWWRTVVGVVLGAAVVAFASTRIAECQQTGFFFPVRRVERLVGPVRVLEVREEGLALADGRVVGLCGIKKVRVDSRLLAEAVRDGVEVGVDGRVIGRVRVFHWCGNDRVREDVRRVDLSEMELWAHGDGAGGDPLSIDDPSSPAIDRAVDPGRGWNVSSAMAYFARLGR